jgi:hypothetical protein
MLNSDIEFIDFSTDDCYLVYKDSSGEVTFVDISDKANIKEHINPSSVEFTHEWMQDGLKISNQVKHFAQPITLIRTLKFIIPEKTTSLNLH